MIFILHLTLSPRFFTKGPAVPNSLSCDLAIYICTVMASQYATTRLEWTQNLDVYCKPSYYRKTSIICTIGPRTNSIPMITELIRAGMNIARLNFSHGSHEVILSYFPRILLNSHSITHQLLKMLESVTSNIRSHQLQLHSIQRAPKYEPVKCFTIKR